MSKPLGGHSIVRKGKIWIFFALHPTWMDERSLETGANLREVKWVKKINLSTVFAGQAVGIKEVEEGIWLVGFMDYDLGYFDLEEKTLQPLANPFGPKVLPI